MMVMMREGGDIEVGGGEGEGEGKVRVTEELSVLKDMVDWKGKPISKMAVLIVSPSAFFR